MYCLDQAEGNWSRWVYEKQKLIVLRKSREGSSDKEERQEGKASMARIRVL